MFPRKLAGKGKKANLRRIAKRFSIANKDRQVDIIHDIQEGSGDINHSNAMSDHLGRTTT